MSARWTPWAAQPQKDRLKRYAVVGFAEGPGKPVICENIRTVDDANVLAAAPDLLAAVKALLPRGWRDGHMDHMPGVKLARLAIDRAKGRS